MSFDIPTCLSPSLLPPPSGHGGPPQFSRCYCKETGFSSCDLQQQGSQALTHLFPRDRSLPPDNLTPCSVAQGWKNTSKLLSISSTYKLACVYCSSGMLASPLGKAGFLQFLPCWWVSGQVSSLRVFSQPWQEGSRQAHCSTGFVVLAKIHLPATRHTGGQDFSQGSQSSTRSFCSQMDD